MIGKVSQWLTNIAEVLSFKRARILAYHSIAVSPADAWAVTPAQLEGHLRYLCQRGFQLCSLPSLVTLIQNGADVSKRVCVTFDDGFADFNHIALPILRAWDAPAMVFVPLGKVGGRSDWSRAAPGRALMTWEELEACLRAGVAIGSHGMSHGRLTELPTETLRSEIEESREQLRARWGITEFHFAYPYGEAGERERAAVQDAGYRSAAIFGGLWGNRVGGDLWALNREPMLHSDSLAQFAAMLYGWRDLKELWRAAWNKGKTGAT